MYNLVLNAYNLFIFRVFLLGINQTRSSTTTAVSQKVNTASKLLIALITLVLLVAAIIVYVELTRKPPEPLRGPIFFSNNYEHDTCKMMPFETRLRLFSFVINFI